MCVCVCGVLLLILKVSVGSDLIWCNKSFFNTGIDVTSFMCGAASNLKPKPTLLSNNATKAFSSSWLVTFF